MASKDVTMFDQFEHKGHFWLPGQEQHAVPGVLNFRDDDITLDLFGLLRAGSSGAQQNFSPGHETPIILGQGENQALTLYRNTEIGTNWLSAGRPTSTVSSTFLFVGEHYKSESDLQFDSLSVNFTDLEEWVAEVPFKQGGFRKEGQKLTSTEITYTFPDTFEIEVARLDATVGLTFSLVSKGPGYRSHTLEHVAFLEVSPKESRAFRWFMDALVDLQHLLALFVHKPVYPKLIVMCRKTGEGLTARHKESSKVYYCHSDRNAEGGSRPVDMLLPLPKVRTHLSGVLAAWFAKLEQLRDVSNLHFGALYRPKMYLESHFLVLMQALESFSRSLHDANYLSQADYQRVAAALNAAIPPDTGSDLKASLKSRIKYGNEYSLRKRLSLIFDSLQPETLALLCKDAGRFKGKVVDTRNYYTHYSDELKGKILEGEDLYWANQRLRLLLTILLLKEITIDEATIRQAISDNARLKQMIDLYLAKEQ